MKKYDLLVPTSAGIRLTPASGQLFHAGGLYSMQATSAETNVASIPSYLGLHVKVLTALVKDSPVAEFIRQDLQGRGMDVEAVEVPQGGPWGWRHQINMADAGFGLRGPRVWNDRAGEVGRSLKSDLFDLKRIFAEEGVRMIHLSGLIAALAPELCLSLARMARANDTMVSFDLNYRASFWEGQADRLRTYFGDIAANADILIGNEEDFQLCLGIEGPETGGKDLAGRTEAFKEMIDRVGKRYKPCIIATTLREVLDANTHLWGAIVASRLSAPAPFSWTILPPREIHVLDRIGGGDGFVGGLLYGLLKGWDIEKCAQFGWGSGVLAVTLPTDYAMPADETQIWSIWNGNARVKR